MHDRRVRQVVPPPESNERPRRFSEYLSAPNIVLLGDAGAGKSHLFRHFAAETDARLIVARHFLSADFANLANQTLFIDALDERRAGRQDQGTVDAIVRRLTSVKPKQVRIACRAADWLGETDLASFQPYFNTSGPTVVIALDPLSEEEQLDILAERGHTDPSKFLEEAERRGVSDLLLNPQNLVMLLDVVQKRDWPISRSALFAESVNLVLSEHNLSHTRSVGGGYVAAELVQDAGAACALRLISDIDGISLVDGTFDARLPSYREITLCDPTRLLAALGRRAFVGGSVQESVDYSHRTVAEYLGAQWLAARVRNGLPFGRVRALVGTGGRPASELRGLHAWLSVFLPEHAPVLIDADAFGILSYGDVSSFSTEIRIRLLEALAQLSQIDPWFRGDSISQGAVAALSGSDMVVGFRRILRDKNAGYGLRSIVLDALGAGVPLPGLLPDIDRILRDSNAPYGERERCVRAVTRIGALGVGRLRRSYRKLGKSESDLRLRAHCLEYVYGDGIGPREVAALVEDANRSDQDLVGGALWSVPDAVPSEDLDSVLDSLAEAVTRRNRLDGDFYRNAFEVVHVIDRLLQRRLESNSEIPGATLLRWLTLRHRCSDEYAVGSDALRVALRRNSSAVSRVVDEAIAALVVSEGSWSFLHGLSELLLHSADDLLLAERVFSAVDTHEGPKRRLLYEIALGLTFRVSADAAQFNRVYDYAESDPELREIRERHCVVEIPEWKTRELERKRTHSAAGAAVRHQNRVQFERNAELIRAGSHFGFLEYIGKLYFGLFSDVDQKASPRGRIATQFGEENARIALEGLLALVGKRTTTNLDEIVRLHESNKHQTWWYGLMAGLDEYFENGGSLDALSDDYLRSAIAIDCLHPTFWRQGNTPQHVEHRWKEELIGKRGHLFTEAYLTLIRSGLRRSSQNVQGLYELFNRKELETQRAKIANDLLHEFPNAAGQVVQTLIGAALGGDEGEMSRLAATARTALRRKQIGSDRARWLAVAFLLARDNVESRIRKAPREHREAVVWALRDAIGARRNRSAQKSSVVSSKQRGFVILLAAGLFPRVGYPRNGWSGDTNPWDASEFVLEQIVRISADATDDAGNVLAKLGRDARMSSYRDHVRHAMAQQRVLATDREYQPPTWKQALETLRNGAPGNIADLQALAMDHLRDLGPYIASTNVDAYKRFWNEDPRGKLLVPKSEDSCRDYLVELLRPLLRPHGVQVEPEGHMVRDKRADIVLSCPGMKLVVELKRDYHADVWTAANDQLDRFYTRDPDARGFGIYGVFWYGARRPRKMRKPPTDTSTPNSSADMLTSLSLRLRASSKERIQAFVLDVSGLVDLGTRNVPMRKRWLRSGLGRTGRRQVRLRSSGSELPQASSSKAAPRGKKKQDGV